MDTINITVSRAEGETKSAMTTGQPGPRTLAVAYLLMGMICCGDHWLETLNGYEALIDAGLKPKDHK